MKVLIVAFAFPPANVIGAIHVGKLARYLDLRDHDVRVLTTDLVADRSLPLEIPREHVIYTDYPERKSWFGPTGRFHNRLIVALDGTRVINPAQGGAPRRSLWQRLRRHYLALIQIPDMRAAWMKAAIPAGRRLIEEWRPDIIYASAPPYTGLVVASRLARSFRIPWVAGLRDLWVDNPYYEEPGWRRRVDALLEAWTLRSAARLVTVSPIWAEQLRRRHRKPTEVIYNGYAAEDFLPSLERAAPGEVLVIRYLGSIYRGFRDPSALFSAIALLPPTLRGRVLVEFYGDDCEAVLDAATAQNVTEVVSVRPRVPYRRALELQIQADVLLLLQWNDRRDEGNLPAKLFEYLYARRPILFIGYEEGVAAQLIRERGAGLVSNSPAQIADQLQAWIADKQQSRLERLDPSVCRGLSRDEQYRKLERLLGDIVAESPGHPDRVPRRSDAHHGQLRRGVTPGCGL